MNLTQTKFNKTVYIFYGIMILIGNEIFANHIVQNVLIKIVPTANFGNCKCSQWRKLCQNCVSLMNILRLIVIYKLLIHWGRVTHIRVSNLTIIGSDNGLPPGRHQSIIWTNAGILLIGPLGTIFSEILIEIHTSSFKKMHLKISSKWQPFCIGLNVLRKWHIRNTWELYVHHFDAPILVPLRNGQQYAVLISLIVILNKLLGEQSSCRFF